MFCHENLLRKSYSMKADNLCKRCNLEPIIVFEELVKLKRLYKLMEENVAEVR